MRDLILSESAHYMALIPLAVLGWLRLRGRRLDTAYWWLAVAFGVSWLADTAAHWLPPSLVSAVYPVGQAGIVAAVLMPKDYAALILGLLVAVGMVGVITHGVSGPEFVIRAVAWGVIVAVVLFAPVPIRIPLLIYYGLGLLAWVGYNAIPGWTSWGIYQGTRAVGLGAFSLVLLRNNR